MDSSRAGKSLLTKTVQTNAAFDEERTHFDTKVYIKYHVESTSGYPIHERSAKSTNSLRKH